MHIVYVSNFLYLYTNTLLDSNQKDLNELLAKQALI